MVACRFGGRNAGLARSLPFHRCESDLPVQATGLESAVLAANPGAAPLPWQILRRRRVPRRPGLSKCEPPWLYKVSPLPTLRPAPLACVTDGLFCTGTAPMAAV